MRKHLLPSVVVLAFTFAACGPSGRTGTSRSDGGGGGNCPASCKMCDPQGFCHDCTPGQPACNLDRVVECNLDGTFGAEVKACDAASKQRCVQGQCLSPCEVAASSHSYIGCEYWPTTTVTAQLNPYFDFAVAVANPAVADVVGASAHIKISRGGKVIEEADIAPGAVETIKLPWVTELSQPPDCQPLIGCQIKEEASVKVKDGAYHLESDLPVTVYQFSPLQYEKPQTQTCMDQAPMGNTCHSYTNDASLLLPTAVLRNEYIVISRQTFAIGQGLGSDRAIPGYFAVVGTEDGTDITVTYSANSEAGMGITAQKPGGVGKYTLDKGEVLQIVSKRANTGCAATSSDARFKYCDMGPKYDLTGTKISATKPVAVFGGHSCSFVPYNKFACDHLEEQLFPVDTWGQKIAAVSTEPYSASKEPNVWRVISGSDNNQVTFDPETVGKATTLNTGEWFEFVAKDGFVVSGTGRVALAQYSVGANYGSDTGAPVGDPDLGLGIPVEQWRLSYDFLTPDTYTKSYVNIIVQKDTTVDLDGKQIGGFSAIGSSGLAWRRVLVQPGAHRIASNTPFGITVAGTASYTSYLYPGGLNLNEIPVQ